MPSHFLLLWVLTANGLEPKDIHQVNMNADAAGAAFVAHKVDAAVTWEPWLSRAKTSNSGHILVSTAQLPGVLVDVLAVRRDFFEKHQQEVQALYEGWMAAIDTYHQSPQTATSIMSKYLKLAPDEFQQNASGLRFADRAYNKHFFNRDSPNSAWLLAGKADQIWKAANLLPQNANSSKFITDIIVLNSSQNQH
jgi:NitT/TauT family transport system substrate-binding protein